MRPEVVASAATALTAVAASAFAVQVQVRARLQTDRLLEAMATLTDPYLASLAADDLMTELLARLRAVTGADLAVLLIVEDAHLAVRAQDGVPRLDPALAVPIGDGLTARVVLGAEPVLVSAVQPEEVALDELRSETRSFLGCPLLVRGEVSGVLALSCSRPGRFTGDHVRLARRVAERLVPTLERAHFEARERELQSAVEQAEHRARTLAEAPALGILEVGRDGRVARWNRAAADLLGLPRWLPGAETPDALVPGMAAAARSAASGRRIDGLEVSVPRSGGATVELSVSATPVTAPDGSIEGAVVMLDDVTERQQMEQQLRRAQRLEAMAQLAGGVAHDFNNLLTVIGGHSDVLLRTLPARSDAREDVAAIRVATDRAAELTRELLAIGRRPAAGAQVLDLHARVRALAPVVERLVGDDIEVRVVTGSHEGWIRVDPNDIDQAVMNLVINARDAMQGSGRVVVETRSIELRARGASLAGVTAGRYVLLTVADNGPGMTKEVAERCFDPFFTTKSRGKGTGLGLSTVYGTASQAGGHATVESAPGRGTTFRVWLREIDPASAEPLEAAPRPRRQRRSGRVVRVLLVEDEAPIRSLARAALEEAAFEVLEAASGEDALARAEREREPIDVLVSDVVLGGMTGDDLAKALRRRWPAMRVILMSGYTGRSLAVEPDVFLEKPLVLEELAAAVTAQGWLA